MCVIQWSGSCSACPFRSSTLGSSRPVWWVQLAEVRARPQGLKGRSAFSCRNCDQTSSWNGTSGKAIQPTGNKDFRKPSSARTPSTRSAPTRPPTGPTCPSRPAAARPRREPEPTAEDVGQLARWVHAGMVRALRCHGHLEPRRHGRRRGRVALRAHEQLGLASCSAACGVWSERYATWHISSLEPRLPTSFPELLATVRQEIGDLVRDARHGERAGLSRWYLAARGERTSAGSGAKPYVRLPITRQSFRHRATQLASPNEATRPIVGVVESEVHVQGRLSISTNGRTSLHRTLPRKETPGNHPAHSTCDDRSNSGRRTRD